MSSAPFPLATYEDVRDRAAQIASVVEQRIMPPWRARQGFGRFLNERCLNADEIERIMTWVRNGAPRGDAADLPPRPQFTAGWQLGQPDFVITMPDEFEVPADGPDIYRNFVIPTGLSTDRLVSALRISTWQSARRASFLGLPGYTRRRPTTRRGRSRARLHEFRRSRIYRGGRSRRVESRRFAPAVARRLGTPHSGKLRPRAADPLSSDGQARA